MKRIASLSLLVLLALFITPSCKKDKGGKEPYDLTNTSWQGEGRLSDRDWKPVKVSFKENKVMEITFIPVDDPASSYSFTGTWAKDELSDNAVFTFYKGLDKVTCTATLTENNTLMADGVFKVDDDPSPPGSFKLTRQ